MSKDDRVRELFKWVKREELSGRLDAAAADEIVIHARSSYCLELLGSIGVFAVGDIRRKITFVGSSLLIQHNGAEWQLVGPDDPKA